MKILKKITFTALFLSVAAISFGCSSNGNFAAGNDTAASVATQNLTFSDLAELDYKPLVEEYKLGPTDSIKVDVFRVPEFSDLQRTVDSGGNISLPLIGTIRAMGLTQQQIEQRIKADLAKTYLQDPQVTVSLLDAKNQKVTLEGWFSSPGQKSIVSGQETLLQVVAKAGGLKELGDPGKIVLFRKNTDGKVKAYRLNLNAIRDGKFKDPYLKSKDLIIAHRSDNRYWLRESARMAGNLFGIGRLFGL